MPNYNRMFPYMGNRVSPVIKDYVRSVSYDSVGNEVVTFNEVPLPIRLGYGDASDWSLDSMLKAGINPSVMPIHTVAGTRMESAADMESFIIAADEIFASAEDVKVEE